MIAAAMGVALVLGLAVPPAVVAGAGEDAERAIVVRCAAAAGAEPAREPAVFLSLLAAELVSPGRLAFVAGEAEAAALVAGAAAAAAAIDATMLPAAAGGWTLDLADAARGAAVRVSWPLPAGERSRIREDSRVHVPDEARALAEGIARLVDRDVDAAEVLLASLDARRLSGDLAAAGSTARALAALFESDARPHRILAWCAEARGQRDGAVEHWGAAVAATPESTRLRFERARALDAAGQPVEAGEAYEDVLRRLDRAAGAGNAGAVDPVDGLAARAREALEALAPRRRGEEARRRAWREAEGEAGRRRDAPGAAADRQAAARRIEELRPLVLVDPFDAARALELGRLLIRERLYRAACDELARAVSRDARHAPLRIELARARLLSGDAAGAAAALEAFDAADAGAPDAAPGGVALEAAILRGDAAMQRASRSWTPRRFGDWGLALAGATTAAYDRLEPPAANDATATAEWSAAGRRYERAVELAPGDARALARLADWRFASGDRAGAASVLEAARARGVESGDLDRIAASLHAARGETALAEEALDRFLMRASRGPDEVERAARGILDRHAEGRDGDAGAAHAAWCLARAGALLEAALESEPAHARLIGLRGRLRRIEGDEDAAAADFRLALALGRPAWDALEAAWLRPAFGPRGQRPPEIAAAFAAATAPPGALRSMEEIIELRSALAATLLESGDARSALVELAPLAAVLRNEEARLRGTRDRSAPAPERVQWTRPDSAHDEPVEFESERDRQRWAALRTLIARAHLDAGEVDAARAAATWAARCLAVDAGAVLPEEAWPERLSARSRELAAVAVAVAARCAEAASDEARARGLAELERRLAAADGA